MKCKNDVIDCHKAPIISREQFDGKLFVSYGTFILDKVKPVIKFVKHVEELYL